MMDNIDHEAVICTPPDIRQYAGDINAELLPKKSRERYEEVYLTYKKWQTSKNIKLTSENVLMVYFKELSQKYKPSTLWSIWSMMKSTLNLKEGIDINQYNQLKSFLKRESHGYTGKKSKVLSPEQIETFLKEAPDEIYLATKVAMIFGISGACRREELANIKLKDVQHQGKILVVKIPDTKTKVPRTFTIEGEFSRVVEKYESIRPLGATSKRFFLNYQRGKCTIQAIGKNKFGAMPKQIAEYLNLPEPNLYTGHSFRRTSDTLLANSGADLITLKRHGGWKSSTVAESYIEDSINNKRKIGHLIASSISQFPSSTFNENSNDEYNIDDTSQKKMKSVDIIGTSENTKNISEATLNIQNNKQNPIYNFHNCNVNINNY